MFPTTANYDFECEIASSDRNKLRELADRYRHKAKGSRWAVERQLLKERGADHRTEIAPVDQELIEQARQTNSFLWMNRPSFDVAESMELLVDLADWFDISADAIELVLIAGIVGDEPVFDVDTVLPLVAEAQFGLWATARTVRGTNDEDQVDLYKWLRQICMRTRLFLPNYLKADESLNVPNKSELRDRIRALQHSAEDKQQRATLQRRLFGKLHYLTRDGDQSRPASSVNWETVAATVNQLIDLDVSPSNQTLRELLAPTVEAIPASDDWPSGFRLTLREIDKVRRRIIEIVPDVQDERSSLIQTVSELLAGRTVILIGGDCRHDHKREIERAFRLAELRWIETSPSTSVSTFEPMIACPDVALALLAIRWASHSYGGVRAFCDSYGKPLVRLPAGLGINQIATQIMEQSSERLRLLLSQ